MVAQYHGYKGSLASLRRKFGISLGGTTLQSVMNIADEIGFETRPLKVSLENLRKLKYPAILHWNFDHFVVLAGVKRNKVSICDPSVGTRDYTWQEVSQRFTGIALELSLRQEFSSEVAQVNDSLTLWQFWEGARGLGATLAQIFFLSMLIQLFALATPFYLQVVVDDVLIKNDVDLLNVLAVGFLVLTLISVVTKAMREFSTLHLVSQLNYLIGDSVFYHLIRLPMSYFEKRHMGDVVSRFNSLRPIQEFISGSLINVVIDGILAITTFVLMFIYSPALAGVAFVGITIYALFRFAQFRPLRNAHLESIAAKAEQDSVFMESIRALQGIKLSGKESERQNAWRTQFVEDINAEARIGRLTISYEVSNNILTGCEYVLIIYLGAQNVLAGVMTVGMLYAFLAYRAHFSSSVISVINQLIQYWMIGLHLERVADITQTEKDVGVESESTLLLPVHGQLSAKNLSYQYGKVDSLIFSEFSIDVGQGAMVAIVGASGVGKTTLLKTLMGLVVPTQGDVWVDGMLLESIGHRSYRHHTAAVMQNDVLFSGSLRENISFFETSPDTQRIYSMAKLACIHDDIVSAPMGYDSLVGDMGSSLSVGQQQRVLLARALYRQPKILFLDEGTAHVDHETELQIMQNLKDLKITCLFVTHNEKLTRFAEQIIYWDGSTVPLSRAC